VTDKPKILTLDIETSPLESWTWGIWDQNIGLEQIKVEWSILAYAAKWLDSKKVIYQDTGGNGADKVRYDYPLLNNLWELLNEADLVIAQNGVRFDIKKINARLIMNGFGPYSPIRVIDTLQVAKKHFGFTSNKLEWQGKYVAGVEKSKHKKFPGFELWAECLKDNPAAWAEMKKYNKQDVIATELLYLKQRPWIANHPNMGTFHEAGMSCPVCDSTDIYKNGTRVLQLGRYQRYHCNNCGAWPRGKQLLTPLSVRKDKLV
jgi:RNase_H superfamily